MNKKAISPIISSLLLIVFAIALGIVVMSWGKGAIAKEHGGSCEEASVNIISLAEKPKACFSGNTLYFTIENNGQMKTTGLKVSFLGDTIFQKDMTKGIIIGEIINADLNFADVGNIQKIKIVPKIIVEGKENVCPNGGVEIENVGECSV